VRVRVRDAHLDEVVEEVELVQQFLQGRLG
jgi:hypothetical protein